MLLPIRLSQLVTAIPPPCADMPGDREDKMSSEDPNPRPQYWGVGLPGGVLKSPRSPRNSAVVGSKPRSVAACLESSLEGGDLLTSADVFPHSERCADGRPDGRPEAALGSRLPRRGCLQAVPRGLARVAFSFRSDCRLCRS